MVTLKMKLLNLVISKMKTLKMAIYHNQTTNHPVVQLQVAVQLEFRTMKIIDCGVIASEVKIMIACDGKDCAIKWFHWSCMDLTEETVPDGEWYCPDCAGHCVN